jgi:hypothetical protein
MNLTALTVQLIPGALAGYAAGNLSEEMHLGTIGNTIVGARAGMPVIRSFLLGLSGTVQIVSTLLTGGVNGGLTSLLIGFLKSEMYA